jgi:single-strand DNA-binding protein
MLTFLQINGLCFVATEPELHFTPNQTPVVNFSVASNRRWTDQGGSERESSCFIDCVVFGKLAEAVDKHVRKGDPIYIEGNLNLERWEKDGRKHSKHSVSLSKVVFLKPKD